ncbi:Dirigent protein - like 10 [Theobroma cacao]|nr:Dirigent protein - like 10 [Theobroma cacao]
MAKTLSELLSSTSLFLFTLLFFSTTLASTKSNGFSNILSPAKLGLKQEKLSHLHFYFHDIVSGPKPSAVRVASAAMTNKSATGFGAVVIIDDPLTVAPERNSKLVGKAQGIYASAAQDEFDQAAKEEYFLNLVVRFWGDGRKPKAIIIEIKATNLCKLQRPEHLNFETIVSRKSN